MEVSQNGDLANYMIPGKLVKGMGVLWIWLAVQKIIVVMEHTNKHGETKLKKECTLPLMGKAVVHKLITELEVFEFENGEMFLVELMQGVSLEDIKAKTEAEFKIKLKGV
ncbi:CoA-transferase [Campylobacter upsaliensis]|uniref:CoA-transferase n=1 Tax=Campylobacter upsaliensis TaxID=28080 RepID=UPI00399D5BDB